MTELDKITWIIGFIFIIIIGGWIKIVISLTLKRNVVPKLANKGLHFIRYKWVGPIGTGDFNKLIFSIPGLFSLRGTTILPLYFYIFYRDNVVEKRITIKINTIFFFVKSVEYSNEL